MNCVTILGQTSFGVKVVKLNCNKRFKNVKHLKSNSDINFVGSRASEKIDGENGKWPITNMFTRLKEKLESKYSPKRICRNKCAGKA